MESRELFAQTPVSDELLAGKALFEISRVLYPYNFEIIFKEMENEPDRNKRSPEFFRQEILLKNCDMHAGAVMALGYEKAIAYVKNNLFLLK